VTCQFSSPIVNGTGFDFAVFENSIDDSFLELAFVEVSSDGINFFRFPSHSLTDTSMQTWSFGPTDAMKINNLAGKYRAGYGTPFDLQELANTPGLNVNNITHVRIIDVVGSIQSAYASRDSKGNKINDPWPTAFGSSGFDLDAVAVLAHTGTDVDQLSSAEAVIFPNPVQVNTTITPLARNYEVVQVLNGSGMNMGQFQAGEPISFSRPGLYIVDFISKDRLLSRKKIVVTD